MWIRKTGKLTNPMRSCTGLKIDSKIWQPNAVVYVITTMQTWKLLFIFRRTFWFRLFSYRLVVGYQIQRRPSCVAGPDPEPDKCERDSRSIGGAYTKTGNLIQQSDNRNSGKKEKRAVATRDTRARQTPIQIQSVGPNTFLMASTVHSSIPIPINNNAPTFRFIFNTIFSIRERMSRWIHTYFSQQK